MILSDEDIEFIRKLEKIAVNPRARRTIKAKHEQLNYDLVTEDDKYKFRLITRQSLKIKGGFSCGLILSPSSESPIILARYNGYDHPHTNRLEGNRFDAQCHIHTATARYLEDGKRSEGYAEITTRFDDLDGAFNCLLEDWNVSGLKLRKVTEIPSDMQNDTLPLFDNEK